MCASLLPRLGCAFASLGLVASLHADLPEPAFTGEYFFDSDPGVGAATPFAFPETEGASGELRASFTLPAPATPGAGLRLGIRVRNDSGKWSATSFRHLYLLQSVSAPQVESTWDNTFASPPVARSPEDGRLTLTRPVPDTHHPSPTPDRLALRPSADGLAGHTVFRQVSSLGGRPPVRLYHAVDASPDPATALSVELTDTHRLSPTALTLDLGNLSPGFHSLHLQVHDAGGAFTETVRFLHVTPSTVATLTGLAYTFADSADNTTPVAVAPLTVSESAQEIVLTAPNAEVPTKHTLVLNLLDSQLDAGLFASASLRVSTPYHEWLRTALPKRPSSETALLADPDGDLIVNLLEFAFGLNPAVKDTEPPYRIRTRETADEGKRFRLTYRQRAGGTGEPGVDYTAQGLRYLVQTSTDMKTWRTFNEAPGVSAEHTRIANDDGTETVNLNLFVDDALDHTRTLFVRLTVKLAD